MEDHTYLIPANSKKSMLYLGMFNLVDLFIFGAGVLITLILILAFAKGTADIKVALLVLLPGLISIFLVIPIPNQHNIRTLIANIYRYFTGRRTYFWKGWCVSSEEEDR